MGKKEDNNQKVKKSKKGIVIGIIIFVILLILSIGGFFLYQYLKSNQSIEEDWGQTYYVYLKKLKKILKKLIFPIK